MDYDGDGDQDLYLVNDVSLANVLYRNNGSGAFSDVAAAAGANYSGDGMGVTAGDYDNDGDCDMYLSYGDGNHVLYRNNGNGSFGDVTASAGMSRGDAGRGAAWGAISVYGSG